MRITHDALKMLAAEEAAFPKAEDALDRLAFLVGPLLLPLKVGFQVTSERLSDIIEENFGLKLPIEVSQTLLFRLAKRNFLTQTMVEDSSVFFGMGVPAKNGSKTVDSLIKDFRIFVRDKSLLPKITDDEILDLFMTRVFELEDVPSNFAPAPIGKTTSSDWKSGLISDYILAKSDTESALPPLLAKLAELCLLRSVVGNLTTQKVKTTKSSMTALLDAPLALYSIGASGQKQKNSVEATFGEARNLGMKICMLPVSIEEMKRVLGAVLNTPHVDRRGPTAAAIRAGEISEVIVQDIQNGPEKYVEKANIQIIPRTLSTYPNELEYFTQEAYEEFSAIASRWSKGRAAEDHDAEALTVTMRARQKKHERNLFYNTFTFITGNWIFAQSARRFCLDRYAINENVSPPILHFSSFSASIWIAAGFPTASKLPEKTLLAACERTLNGQTDVISKANRLFKQFQVADEQHLDAYFQDRDCINSIVKETYNDPSLIDEENVSELFEKVRHAAAAEVLAKSKQEADDIIRKYDQKLENADSEKQAELTALQLKMEDERQDFQGSLSQLGTVVAELKDDMAKKEKERSDAIFRRVQALNKRIEKKSVVDWVEFSFFTLASLLVCFQVSLSWGILAFVLGYAFVTMSYFEYWFPYRFKMRFMRWYGRKKMEEEFSVQEISEWRIKLHENLEIHVGSRS